MKEMTKSTKCEMTQGGLVKKTLFAAAVTAALVLALGGSAFAAGINHSGQQRLGARQNMPVVTDSNGNWVSGGESALASGGITINGAGTNTYMDWNTAAHLGTNGTVTGDNSPHGNYATTTVKCVVCHAVHYAAPGGAPVGSPGQTADTLLRVKASDACVYCHATAGMAVNGRPVYDGAGLAITDPGTTGGATKTGHITGTNCTYCHTNVHGANADHTVASLDGYLLKLMPAPAPNVQKTGMPAATMLDAITAIDHNAENQGFAAGSALSGTIGDYANDPSSKMREQAVGIFCAECHNGAYDTGAAGAATNINGSNTVAFSGHRIAATATNDWNTDGTKSSGLFKGDAVAYAAATNCKSCHDAKDTFGNTAFPHSWGGTKMWLMSAADAAPSTATTMPYGNDAGASTSQLTDGVCLKCHVASGGTSGVGITF